MGTFGHWCWCSVPLILFILDNLNLHRNLDDLNFNRNHNPGPFDLFHPDLLMFSLFQQPEPLLFRICRSLFGITLNLLLSTYLLSGFLQADELICRFCLLPIKFFLKNHFLLSHLECSFLLNYCLSIGYCLQTLCLFILLTLQLFLLLLENLGLKNGGGCS